MTLVQQRLLPFSVVFSLLVHLACILFLQHYSLWFYTPKPTVHTQPLPKAPRHEILHLATVPATAAAGDVSVPSPTAQKHKTSLIPTPVPLGSAHSPQALPPFPSDSLASSSLLLKKHPFVPIELLLSVSKDLALAPLSQSKAPSTRLPRLEPLARPRLAQKNKAVSIPKTQISIEQPPLQSFPIATSVTQPVPSLEAPSLPELPTLADLDTTNLSDAFESELLFFQQEDGYLFALTLIPRKDLDLPLLKQNITFLVDRSNSIQQERLTASKQALRKALHELGPETSFNVMTFDNKVEKCFPAYKAAVPSTVAAAEQFLENIRLGSFFSTADVYTPLLHTVPGKSENEVFTTVLLTDGESLAKKQVQRLLLHNWTTQNSGKSALYAVAMEADGHLGTLDAMTALNQGKLLYANTKRGLKRKVLKLMKMIHAPVAKNVSVKTVGAAVELERNVSTLYLNQPYVILGTTKTLDDFVIFFQGRMKDRWLHVKKPVSFLNGKQGGHALQAEWARQKAYRHYEQYAADQNPQHVADAHALLEPFQIQTAFE